MDLVLHHRETTCSVERIPDFEIRESGYRWLLPELRKDHFSYRKGSSKPSKLGIQCHSARAMWQGYLL